MRRPLLALAAVATTAALATGPALAPATATAAPGVPNDEPRARIPLPKGFQPEGIATGPRATAYLGSLADGDLYRLDLRTGKGEVFSQGPGTPSTGLKYDRGRLFVSGGTSGTARVVDARSGDVLASYQLVAPGTPAFVNDVVVTKSAAWFTNSQEAALYRLPLGPGKRLPDQAEVGRVALSGAWVQGTGLSANGITTSPDGAALLVVNSSNGTLYRVTPDGVATAVDLRGYALTNGDGLLREGRTLYVVQNRLNQVAVLRLSKDGLRGKLRDTLTSPKFDVPTTIARSRGDLYLPNARFGTEPTPTTRYWVTGL